MARILLLTHGTEGDVRPLVQIGKTLRAAGHDVACVTHCVFEPMVVKAGLDFATFDTPAEYERMLLDIQQAKTLPELLRQFQEYNLDKYPVKYGLLRQLSRPSDTVLVINSIVMTLAQIVAERLGLPIVSIFLSPSHVSARALREKTLGVLFKPLIDRFRVEIGLPPAGDAAPVLTLRSVSLWPDWFAAFNPAGSTDNVQAGFLPGGDPHEPLPEDVEALLASGPAPILLTGGTGVFVGESYFSPCLEACRRLGRRVILVARRQLGVPHPLPPGVSLFPALPFASLMPRVAAVIHHGGIGTITQALAAGVPQVILAAEIDRPDNAMRVERRGVGKFLPPRQWTAEAVTAALSGVVDNLQVSMRCQDLAGRIRKTDSLAALTGVIEQLVQSKETVKA